ncbi:hypothetical protein FGO68_gene7898 [Halteria grandinella]|uniref:Uncharacterized protein n=1 Tax=Halteria grandinella TaxID=5974 RepID=A0A8J8NIW0_HALGN|nr:hypothetical protein FGO68_gene7898 [Halteria grandinella]
MRPLNILGALIIIVMSQVLALQDCYSISPEDGVYELTPKLVYYGLSYPGSFTLTLFPQRQCFYIANRFLKVQWDQATSNKITGQLFEYDFDGFDGTDTNTCKLRRRLSLDQNEHVTGFLDKKSDVCSNIVLIKNNALVANQTVTFISSQGIKLGYSLFLVCCGSVLSLILSLL